MVRLGGVLGRKLRSVSSASSRGDGAALDRGPGAQAGEGALQLAHVRLHVGAQVQRHVVGQDQVLALGLALEDGHPGLEVGLADLGDEAPGEAAAQAILQAGQLAGQLVAGEDDLLVRVVKGVEGVEELVLRAVLVRQELDVVDEQDVGLLAVACAGTPPSGSTPPWRRCRWSWRR